ncbi:hypothetical protein CALCODRAFT_502488 [Calocera cornea HHB12733]|uniref:Uncharacterized protein n=1 Tax=Calocera cornea HHB12733 TaxID=1353952 RepID=A0A165D8R5_9BASI|nr:hypothetical protein CALCODRAFT_502488 [Calocera cornea HHB12733]
MAWRRVMTRSASFRPWPPALAQHSSASLQQRFLSLPLADPSLPRPYKLHLQIAPLRQCPSLAHRAAPLCSPSAGPADGTIVSITSSL